MSGFNEQVKCPVFQRRDFGIRFEDLSGGQSAAPKELIPRRWRRSRVKG